MVHIQVRKIYEKKHRDQIKYLDLSVMCGYGLLNDLDFNLYIMLSTSHVVAISDESLERLK